MTWTIAFYGAGERATPYLKALGRRTDVQVTAVCDLDHRAAEQVAAGWGATAYLSYEAMLRASRPDALWVTVEPHLQGDILLQAAELGIPFFVEPPGALDFDRARLVARAVAEHRLVTAIGYRTRHTDVLQEAREYLGANPVPLALGWWLRPPETADAPASATGVLWSEACHLVDALGYFCGDVVRVQAATAAGSPAAPAASPAVSGGLVVQLHFASGNLGVLTCAAYPRPDPRLELELLGEGWTLSFAARPGEPHFTTLRLIESDKTTQLRSQKDPAADHAALFLEAVAAGRPEALFTSYGHSLRTLAVCHAITRSAAQGAPIDVATLERPALPES